MPHLVTITGPIAAGKNALADRLAARLGEQGRTVAVGEVDDVAAMVRGPGAAATGLWHDAHDAHAALLTGWARTPVDVVIAVGPFYGERELAALATAMPTDPAPVRVLLDAPVEVTWERALADPTRGLSRQREFHLAAHARFRRLLPDLDADLRIDTSRVTVDVATDLVLARLPETPG